MKATEFEKARIYREYYGKVYGYLRNHITGVQNAEDLASEIFLKVYEKLDSFDETKASISTWIYTIMRNTMTDWFRTRRVFEEIPETKAADSLVEDEVLSTERLALLAKGLSRLEERQRDIIILRFYSGKTLKEIAEKMGISYAYVKVLQTKALEQLKKILGEE